MERDRLKELIKQAEKQIDLVERPARSTSSRLLEAARDYLYLLEQPSNDVNAPDTKISCKRCGNTSYKCGQCGGRKYVGR